MIDALNLHLKVQNLCDCFARTDQLEEMSNVARDADAEEAALKWIALAVLHGVAANAEHVSLSRSEQGVRVSAEYKKSELASPGAAVGEKVARALHAMAKMQEVEGTNRLTFGIDNQVRELQISSQLEDGTETITLTFP